MMDLFAMDMMGLDLPPGAAIGPAPDISGSVVLGGGLGGSVVLPGPIDLSGSVVLLDDEVS